MPERITRDVDAIVAAFASQAGDSAGRYHAEAILRAWNHDRDGAVRVMREALDRDPADTQILYHYARLLHQMGRHDEAMPLYERIIASDRHEMRQWEETHRHLSELYAEAREDAKHRALIAGFEGYVADGARHLQGDLLRMYVRAGMFDRVVEQGPEFLKVNANDTGVAGLIAEAHRELGNDDEAERYHRLANPAYALVGRKAPAFTLKDAEGGERSLQMLAGKPILLSLWWSGGVPGHVSHMAAVEKLHGEYAGDGLVVLGGCVSTGIGGRTRELGLLDGVATFPILFDGRTAYQAYGIEAAATVLIDDQGYVRHVTTDPGKEAEALRTAVTTVLASADGAAASSARIAGFARDEDGAPVPGATITVYVRDTFESRLREIDQTRSGVDGAFALEARPALAEEAMQNGARYQVVGIAEGRSLGLANVNSVFDELEAVELLFTTPADLTGTLADESGQPVEDAQVFIRSAVERGPGGKPTPGSHRLLFFTGRGYGPLSATTAADGSFTIRALPTGVGGLVSVRHADYAHVHESYDLSSGAPLRASVPRAGVLTGRVYYAGMLAGRPPEEGVAPDIEVRVQTAMPAALDRQIHGSGGGAVPYPRHFGIGVKTDAEGRYRIEGIPGGYLNIWAEAEGYTCVAWDTFQITAGQIHTADLFLIEGGFIVGRVLDDETGRPLRPGERSDVGLHGPSRPMSGDAVDHARIAEDGTYRLRAAPGVNFPYLRARPPWTTVGPPDQRWAHLVNVEDGKTVEVEFRVRRADAATAN
jgi:peroxiredoxin